MAQKVQTFVNFLTKFVHMVTPLEITRQGYTENFCFLYTVKDLSIDLYRVQVSLGSCKRNVQFFTLVFIKLEPVSRLLLGQNVNILLDLAIVVLKYHLRDSSIVYLFPQGNTSD